MAKSTTEETRAVVEKFCDLLTSRPCPIDEIDNFIIEDYIQHYHFVLDGRQSMKDLTIETFSDPDYVFNLKYLLVDGDLATAFWELRTSASAPTQWIADLWRVEDGKVVEHWGVAENEPPNRLNPREMF